MEINKVSPSPISPVATKPLDAPGNNDKQNPVGTAFGELLGQKLDGKQAVENLSPKSPGEGIRFSQHALERMANRGISFSSGDIIKLNEAVDKASQKGSQTALVLMGNNAFVVGVKNKTVVTAMDREAMKENVFTNIDSTVIL